MPGDFATTVRPQLEAQLGAGEELQGVVAATQQKTFSGQLYALGVTDRRLLLLPLDRHLHPKGEVQFVAPETLASAGVDGAGGGWWSAGSAILDATAVKLELKTTDGEKLKLTMMKGAGMLGRLGGGEAQREGVETLAAWLRRHAER